MMQQALSIHADASCIRAHSENKNTPGTEVPDVPKWKVCVPREGLRVGHLLKYVTSSPLSRTRSRTQGFCHERSSTCMP